MLFGCVGGLGEKTTARGFNRATQALRQTGSASKPFAVLVPGIEEKIITSATIFSDEPTTFNDGSDNGYSPTNYNDYRGDITVRQATESSQNIPFVKMMEQITPKTSIKYMKKMGISSLTETDENLNLALGGLDKGISPLEVAGAYLCIANNGVYIEPTFYTKIENSIGKIVVKSKQKKSKAFSKQTAYILKSLLTEPVTGSLGTAKYCNIPGMDVAAKTGTTNEEYDRWLCGFTPYYTAATWFGFDMNETIKFNRKNPSGQIWSNVMKRIHKDLPNASFGNAPIKIATAEICSNTGLLANSGCSSYTEYFLKGTLPNSYCKTHSGSKLDTSLDAEESEKAEIPDVSTSSDSKTDAQTAPTTIIENGNSEKTQTTATTPDNNNSDKKKPENPITTPETPSSPSEETTDSSNTNTETEDTSNENTDSSENDNSNDSDFSTDTDFSNSPDGVFEQ